MQELSYRICKYDDKKRLSKVISYNYRFYRISKNNPVKILDYKTFQIDKEKFFPTDILKKLRL